VTSAPSLIVSNARVWRGAPAAAPQAIAIANGTVLAIGSDSEILERSSPGARVLDARGATVTPGLSDAHIHLLAWSRARVTLDLTAARSRHEALVAVARALERHPDDRTLVGRGWQDHAWSEAPDRASLDRVTGERPVLLHHKDFHTLWVNSAALRRAGVGPTTLDPPGGRIERNASGEPTGVLREHAVRLVRALEAETERPDRDLIAQAIRRLHAFGITAVHDFEGAEARRVLSEMMRGAGPRLRVLMHVAHADLDAALSEGLASGAGDDTFRIGALKLFADGTLGSRTASLLEPYDGSTDRGLDLMTAAELRDTVRRSAAGGLSVAVHAIGDRACRSALDAFESAASELRRLPLAPRIEHVQLLDPEDRPRFAALGVAASMQPAHCVADIDLAERHWGTRRRHTYPWRDLVESGALLAFGSDAPVEDPSIATGLRAALTRERLGEGGAYVPEQCIDLDRALAAYTEGAARLAGLWPRAGRLAVGAHADLVVWNADLHALRPAEVGSARPVLTVLGGEVVFDEEEPSGPPRATREESQPLAEKPSR
jgi:predicted amidohydrolase YtcJ